MSAKQITRTILLTGMTRAAKVLPRTTLRSYMMFCGATLLNGFQMIEWYIYSR